MKLALIGGHLSPVLALLDVLPESDEVLFIGRKYTFEGDKALSLEYKTVSAKGIKFANLSAGRLQRKLTRYSWLFIVKLPVGIIKAFFILLKYKPDVVIGFGGYLSFTVCFAAFLLKIPVVIHEQTLEAGLANRLVAYFARKVCISWVGSEQYFPKKKTVLTGNPIRKAIIYPNFEDLNFNQKLKTVYVTGGSSGAHAINQLIEGCLGKLLEHYNVVHQTGDAKQYTDYDRLVSLRSNLPKHLQDRYFLTKFFDPDKIGSVMQQADLIVSRSGINTTTELIYFGKPSLLIPLPFAQKDEQRENALFLQSLGLGKMLEQNSLTPEVLLNSVFEVMQNLSSYQISAKQTREKISQNASQRLYEIIEQVFKKQ